MAVVQISKIQVRRGKKSQTNIPQLAGGEFGWAVDSQQLYIGNGSVGEGSPFVGNTEVLTERSNIFDLLGAYNYKGYLLDNNGNSVVQTGAAASEPTSRSLQEKLDDFINVRDFGAQGDYSNGVGTDDTAAIQRAIDEVYLNDANKNSERSRRKIYFPAGIYKINAPLYIPSNTALIGEGLDKTVIFQDADSTNILVTIADSSTPGQYEFLGLMNDDTAPRNVLIQGMTFSRNPGSLTAVPIAVIDCLRNSKFIDCKFVGVWQPRTGVEDIADRGKNSAVQFRSLGVVGVENIEFDHCEFRNVVHAVYSDHDSFSVTFRRSKFNFLFRGLSLAETSTSTPGQLLGPQNYLVTDCEFNKVDAEAWKVFANSSSRGHRSVNNKYLDVGNNSLEQSQPTTPVLDFNAPNCNSENDFFQRHNDINEIDINKTGMGSNLVAYVPDVLGIDSVEYPSKTVNLLFNTPVVTPKLMAKAPAWQHSKVIIDYVIRKNLSDLYRTGQIVVNVHPNMAGNPGPAVTMTDTFTYTAQVESIGSTLGGNIRFFANVVNLPALEYQKVGNQIVPVNVTRPTLLVRYANPSGPGGSASITYSTRIVSSYKQF
jgi:hypothetical protein